MDEHIETLSSSRRLHSISAPDVESDSRVNVAPPPRQAQAAGHSFHKFSFKVSGVKCCKQIAAAAASQSFHQVVAAAFISVR